MNKKEVAKIYEFLDYNRIILHCFVFFLMIPVHLHGFKFYLPQQFENLWDLVSEYNNPRHMQPIRDDMKLKKVNY